MPTIEIDGVNIEYRVYGEGVPVFLVAGRRQGRDAFRPLARAMGDRVQVILWDRPNTGESDLYLKAEPSEQEAWADMGAELARRLELSPAYFGGGSAGCRNAVMTAIRHPDVVRGLLLFMATGGPFACQNLGYSYHTPYIRAAQTGGMQAVAQTPHFAERIQKNPRAEKQLLSMDPDEFIRMMFKWNETFYYREDTPVVGATEDQLRGLKMPTLLMHGNDDHHTRATSDRLAKLLPNVEQVDTPWTEDEYHKLTANVVPGKTMGRDILPRLADPFCAFVQKTEAKLQPVAR